LTTQVVERGGKASVRLKQRRRHGAKMRCRSRRRKGAPRGRQEDAKGATALVASLAMILAHVGRGELCRTPAVCQNQHP